MDQKSDPELMALVQAGDQQAFEALYDRYAGAVMGFVFKIIQNEELAAELVQETFIRIWDRCEKYSADKGKFSSWMFGISRNLAIDKYRRLRIRPEAATSESEVRKMESAPSDQRVEESVAGQIRREKVRRVLQELPEEQREIIELSFYRGQSRREIAKNTGLALGTVNSRARLAMIKLSHLLEQDLMGVVEA